MLCNRKYKSNSDATFLRVLGPRLGLSLSLFIAGIPGFYFAYSYEVQAKETTSKTSAPDGYVALNPSLMTGSLQWCYGLNEHGTCQLLLGDARSCRNVEPCTPGSANQCPPAADPWFCYGENEHGSCELMQGDKEFCENVTPCSSKRIRLAYYQPAWGDNLWICFGRKDLGQCRTFFATKEFCEELEPCDTINDFQVSP